MSIMFELILPIVIVIVFTILFCWYAAWAFGKMGESIWKDKDDLIDKVAKGEITSEECKKAMRHI